MTTPDQDFTLKTIKMRDVHFVRLWFTDVLGRLKSFAVIPSELDAALFEIGQRHYLMNVKFMTMDNLHLREEANTKSDILCVIPAGTYLDVVEVDDGFEWGRVSYNGNEGWISLYYAGL